MKKEYGGIGPFLRAFLICCKLGVKDYLIFLADTGPASTNILARDATRLRIDIPSYKSPRRHHRYKGITPIDVKLYGKGFEIATSSVLN